MAIRFALVLLIGSLATKRYGAANALILPSSSQSRFDSGPVTMRSGRGSEPSSITITSSITSSITSTITSTSTALHAGKSSDNDNDNDKKPARAKGVYVRPSGAIEQGSGFFVPGLEGPKVRLVIGLVLLAATGINHFVLLGSTGGGGDFSNSNNNSGNGGLSFSEGIAVVYSVLLLFQFAIEYAKEVLLPSAVSAQSAPTSGAAAKRKLRDSFAAAAAATEVLEQQWSGSSGGGGSGSATTEDEEKEYRSRVQWAAASYLSMTPTTQIMLLARDENENAGGGTVRYRLGGSGADPEASGGDGAAATVGAGVRAALDELEQSRGGRIALPLTHPAVKALLPVASSTSSSGKDSSATTTTSDNENNNNDADDPGSVRTVILQRITDGSCWMASSDQLLAGYTSGDLKWLGKLADYVRV